jgi:hypothetical protein
MKGPSENKTKAAKDDIAESRRVNLSSQESNIPDDLIYEPAIPIKVIQALNHPHQEEIIE